jgi:hypothetical protein
MDVGASGLNMWSYIIPNSSHADPANKLKVRIYLAEVSLILLLKNVIGSVLAGTENAG